MLGWQDSNLRIRESKSLALPLGHTPTQVCIHAVSNGRPGKENGVSSGTRTHAIQSHNLTLYH